MDGLSVIDFSSDPSPFVGVNSPVQVGAAPYAPTAGSSLRNAAAGHLSSRSTLYIVGAAVAALLGWGYWTHTINK